MVGGTSFHRRIHRTSHGRNAERVPWSEDKSEPLMAPSLEVSLDNADTVIEGAPPSGCEGGSWVSPSSSSFRDDIDSHKPRLSHYVVCPTAPRPFLRMLHQSTRQRIAVHIIQFFSLLPVRVHVEVVKPRLPERSCVLHWLRKAKPKLSHGAFSLFLSQLFRDPLLQHLQYRRRRAFPRLAD